MVYMCVSIYDYSTDYYLFLYHYMNVLYYRYIA